MYQICFYNSLAQVAFLFLFFFLQKDQFNLIFIQGVVSYVAILVTTKFGL